MSKNLPLFERFFLQPLISAFRIFEKRYKTVKIIFRPILRSIFLFVGADSYQPFVEIRTMSSGSQVIGTPSSYLPVNRIFSKLKSFRRMPGETPTDGWLKLRIMSSYKTPIIFKIIIITAGCRFGTGDAFLCRQKII